MESAWQGRAECDYAFAFREHYDEAVSAMISGTRRSSKNRVRNTPERLRTRLRDSCSLLARYLNWSDWDSLESSAQHAKSSIDEFIDYACVQY